MNEKPSIENAGIAYAAAYAAAISATDKYLLAIADSVRATSRDSTYAAFNDVIHAARAARDAIDAAYAAAEGVRK